METKILSSVIVIAVKNYLTSGSKRKKVVLIAIAVGVLLLGGLCVKSNYGRRWWRHHATYGDTRYQAQFNDINKEQLVSAKSLGIVPQADDKNLDFLVDSGKLVKIHTCGYYKTTARKSYLTPKAANLLEEIGRRYKAKMGKSNASFTVTSMYRTKKDVTKLKGHNGNAVTNSCHLYGTTFDIAYNNLNTKEKRTLANVLTDLRKMGYCHVRYEVNQPCFHITVKK